MKVRSIYPAALAILGAAAPAAAQDPAWTAVLTIPAFPSPYIAEWERNPAAGTLVVLHSGSGGAEYRIDVSVDGAGGRLGRALSGVNTFTGPGTQLFTAPDVRDWRRVDQGADFLDIARRTGLIPEGAYRACARVISVQGAPLTESCVDFRIALPDPPRLILPADGAPVATMQPVFQWTPVAAPAELGATYTVRIVERRTTQSPEAALQSNPIHYEAQVFGAPLLVYPPDALPLEPGREYVWSVNVVDAEGQSLTAVGTPAEVRRFSYQGVTATDLPSELTLVPGVAVLRDLAGVSVRATDIAYVLNGSATLELAQPFTARVPIELRDFAIDRATLAFGQPSYVGGTAAARVDGTIPGGTAGPLHITDIEFIAGQGLFAAARGQVALAGATIDIEGTLSLGDGSYTGELVGEADGGGARIVQAPVEYRVRRAVLRLPDGALELTGALAVDDIELCPDLVAAPEENGGLRIDGSCAPAAQLAFESRGTFGFAVDSARVDGMIAFGADVAAFDVRLAGAFTVRRDGRRERLAEGALLLGPTGASVEVRDTGELLEGGAFDIGLARLTLSNGRPERLAYTTGAGWDVELQFDGRVEFPSVDTVAVTLRGIVLSDEGLYVPAAETPLTGRALDLDGFRVRPVAFRSSETRVTWDAPAAVGWGFGFDAHVHFPDAAPAALRSTWLEAVGLQVGSEGLSGAIRARIPEQEIIVPVAGDVRLAIRELSGALEVSDGSQRVHVDVRAAVLMPSAVRCAADPEGRRPLADAALLRIAADGGVSGVVPIDTPCPVQLGPLALHAANAELTFTRSTDATRAQLAFDATAALPGTAGDTVYGAGAITIDLAGLRLVRGSIAISRPFRWDLPSAGPFFSFAVQSGRIDTTGVVLSGSGTAVFFDLETAVGGGVDVQFRDLTLSLPELRPVAGRATIQQEFALDALWEEGGALRWRGRRADEPGAAGPGLRLVLPANVSLGADGLVIEGTGTAQLTLADTALAQLDARFGPGFMLRIDPAAGVSGGRADLMLDDRTIAYVDSTGIWPGDLLGLAALPDVLPLPTSEIAYLQLRDGDGNPLVEATLGVTGARLRSIADRTVSLVVPALGLPDEFPPAVSATFDLVVDPESFVVRAGSLTATAAEGAGPIAVLRGAGLPISIRTLTYASADDGFALRADADAQMALADGTNALLRGRLTIGDEDVRGVLEVTAPDSTPIVIRGIDPVLLTLRHAAMTLPERTFTFAGGVRVLGRDVACTSDNAVAADDELQLRFGCTGHIALPVGADTSAVRLTLEALAGTVTLDNGTGSVHDYALEAAAHLAVGPAGSCDADLDLALSPDSLTLTRMQPSCSGGDTIQLGWVDLAVSALELEQLSYTTAAGLDFALRVDLQPTVSALPDLRMPALHDVRVTQSGLELPAAEAPGPAQPLTLAGIALRIDRVRIPALQLSWEDWTGGADGGFRFDFDGSMAFTGAGAAAPACLTGQLAFTNGALSASGFGAELVERVWESGCAVPLGGDARFEITRLAGELAVTFDSVPRVERTPGVSGALVLPAPFACSGAATRIEAGEPLSLAPDGVLTGTLALDMPCTRTWPALALTFPDATIEFGRGHGGQSIRLAGAADATFTIGTEPVHGIGELELDVGTGRIVDGSLELQGPFDFDLPREHPAFSFELQAAGLDSAGLRIDGAATLSLPDEVDVDVQFNGFTLDLSTLDIIAGRALFATPFGLEAGVSEADSLGWRAVAAGAPLELQAGVRLDLPPGVSLGENGLAARGQGAARLRLGGRDLPLSLTASDDFALDIQPFAVTAGVAQLAWQGDIAASIDALGFHPNVGFFADALVPARLGLPAEAVAYLELRDAAGVLRVDVTEDEGGVRIRTRAGEGIPLVMPALGADDALAPSLDVALDVRLDGRGREIVSGSVHVAVPEDRAAAFDMSRRGVPFAVDSLSYEAIDGVRELVLAGRLALFGERQGARNEVQLALRADGGVHGSVDVRPAQTRSLLPGGSDAVALRIDSVAGTFDGARFALDVGSAILLRSADGDTRHAAAVLHVTEAGLSVVHLEAEGDSVRGPGFAAGPARLHLSRLRVPRLAYERASRTWDFELLFDAELELTALDSLRIGPLVDITVTPAGFTLPAFDVAQLDRDTIDVRGFSVVPLAFRSQAFTVDWNGAPSVDGAFTFDLELGFPASAPGALAGTRLTVLNAGFNGSRFTGDIESREPPQPIVVALPGDMELHVARLGGALLDDDGMQGVRVTAAGSLLLPPAFNCEGEDSLLAFPPTAELTLGSDGAFAGTIAGIAPDCPLLLGPLALTAQEAALTFAGERAAQTVVLAMAARLRLSSPTPGDSVVATGDVTVDLVNARLVNGSIQIAQPFLWNLPAEDPLLTFRVQQGRVDMAGLTITGTGVLQIDGPDIDPETIGNSLEGEVAVAFDNLTLSLEDFTVTGGSARFLSGFTLDAVLEDAGGIRWRTSKQERPREPGPGVRVVLPEQAELGADGLRLDGMATGELQFGQAIYGGLAVAFSNGFALGWEPHVGVRTGRADLMLENARIAHIDSAGFWPGDIFAVAPLPAQLPLPVLETAYLQLRDAGGTALVETETSAEGVRLRTRPGEFVQLVVPALASAEAGAGPPALNIALDVVVNPANQRIVSGTIEARSAVDAAPLFALPALPLSVTRLTFAPGADGYGFTLDAQMLIPGAAEGARILFENLMLDENGLAGTAEFGAYVESAALADAPVLELPLTDDLQLGVVGARAAFGPDSSVVRLAGVLHSGLFRTLDGTGAALFFSGGWRDGAFAFDVDPQSMPGGVLPVGAATFEPVAVNNEAPMRLTAAGADVTLRLNGILRVPQLGDGFAVTVLGLEVGTRGVTFPQLALTPGAESQEASVFGARLALRDSVAGGQVVHSALGIAYAGGVLTLELAGDLTLLERTARFHGLRIRSDGEVRLAGASLLSAPLEIVPGIVALDSLNIADSRLRARVSVTLPAPLGTGATQNAWLSIAPDGSMEGGGALTLLDETQGLGGDRTQTTLGVATLHPRHVRLVLDANDPGASAVEAVADLYLGNIEDNRIELGDVQGGIVTPGLRIGFDGAVTWGNFALAREFDFDFDAVRLRITSISAPPANGAFNVGFSGELSLNLSAVEGAVAFSDFQIDDRGRVRFNPNGVEGGEFTIAGMVNLAVGGFSYSEEPTTLELKAGGLPSADADATDGVERIDVASYIRFGGAIDVVDVFAGGVDEFLLYRTPDGSTGMAIRRATLSIQNLVAMEADFRYRETEDGFQLLLGASGELLEQYAVGLVGAIERQGTENRVGLFLTAGVTIPITPAVIITELGGGFFYNPRPEHLALVRQYANVSGSAGDRLAATDVGGFAGLLYGGVMITPAGVAQGRVLLTAGPQAMRVDGMVEVLHQGDRFTGDMHLVVGLKKAYAEGTLALDVEYAPVLDGHGDLAFYVYGPNTWGVLGEMDVGVIGYFDGEGQLFAGPPGFVVHAEFGKELNAGVIKLNGGVETTVWHNRAEEEVGGYVRIGAKVSVMDGAATAEGNLSGAVVHGNSSAEILAAGKLEACVFSGCKKFNVWAKIDDSGAEGGFGSRYAAQLDAARDAYDEMVAAQEDAQDALDAAAISSQSIALSAADLAAAYMAVQSWTDTQFRNVWDASVSAEAVNTQPGEIGYRGWYQSLLSQSGAPVVDTMALGSLNADVVARLADLESRRTQVMQVLDALQLDAIALEEAAERPIPESPVLNASFAQPVTHIELDANGDTIKVMENGPGFEVDASLAAEAVTVLRETVAAEEAAAQRMRDHIAAIETAVADLRALLTDSAAGSALDYARFLSGTRSAAELPFARQADMVLRRQDWFRARLAELGSPSTLLNTVTTTVANTTTTTTPVSQPRTAGALTSTYLVAALPVETRYETIRRVIRNKTAALLNNPDALFELTRRRMRALDYWTGAKAAPGLHGALSTIFAAAPQPLAQQVSLVNEDMAVPLQGLIAKMDASESLEDAFEAAANGMPTPEQKAAFVAQEATASGMLLWYHLARAGVNQTDIQSDSVFATVRAAAAARVGQVEERHVEVSGALARLFRAHAAVTAALHDMYDGYLEGMVDSTVVADPVAAQFRMRRDQLAAELQVPGVEGLQVVSTSHGYYATQSVQWRGVHASGAYEYLMRDLPGGAPIGSELFTVGSSGQSVSHRFALSRDQLTVPRTVLAGARAGAGYTGTARADYTITYTPPGVATQPAPGSYGTLTDATAPLPPSVRFIDVVLTNDAAGAQAWLSTQTSFLAEWSAQDPESGIAAYRYAVGTAPSDSSLRGWTDVGGRSSVRFDDIAVVTDRPVVVTVQARNGQGMWSALGASPPLRRDVTPPSFAANAALELAETPAGAGADAPALTWTACPVALPLVVDGVTHMVFGTQSTMPAAPALQLPRLALLRPSADDAESGLRDYIWRADTLPPLDAAAGIWTEVAGSQQWLVLEGAALDYERQLHVSVAARNRAGLTTAPITYGPVRAPDPTAPSPAQFCLGTSAGRLAVAVTTASVDPETGIAGYQYRVLNGAAVVRDWPATGTDFAEPGAATTLAGITPVDGGVYTAELRAVNGHGQPGRIARSGPVYIDASAPPAPTISASVVSALKGRALRLVIDAPADPQSGLHAHYVRIATSSTGLRSAPLIDWRPVTTAAEGSYTWSIQLPSLSAGQQLFIELRAVNRAGLARSVYGTATIPVATTTPTTTIRR